MKKIYTNYETIISSPIGQLGIVINEKHLISIDFLYNKQQPLCSNHPLAILITEQLQAYFANPGYTFAIPMQLHGTPFQKRVWQALQKIPVGQTINYGSLAKTLQSSPRAIGGACRANPIPIIVPCHRVVAQNHLGGFSGATQGETLSMKEWLLKHENLNF